ncbi:MAG: hypothetical protein O7E52_16995 [Candidatus Poribacteria bacterium]|nr:hypothetical protein [Candidatus Poribacteria bacterium]
MHLIERNRTFLPLSFNHRGSLDGNRIGVFVHAINYYVAETRGVDFDNYEATTGYFPVNFNPDLQPGIDRPHLSVIEGRPEEMQPGKYVARVDYIVTWSMDLDFPVVARIREHYQQIYVSDNQRLRIFARKE